MPTISDSKKAYKSYKNKIDYFTKKLWLGSFFLLIKPSDEIYSNFVEIDLIERQIEQLINAGLINLEISWSKNKKWLDYVSNLKLKFPQLNLGSASITNKKSIDDSIEVGLGYSMMKFWDKDLLNYANINNHLLIPGIKDIKDLKEAIDLNCKIIKIYPVTERDKLIDISQYKDIDFIAAGGLSISDMQLYKSLGYRSIIIGNKGLKNKVIDPNIYRWLKTNRVKTEIFKHY